MAGLASPEGVPGNRWQLKVEVTTVRTVRGVSRRERSPWETATSQPWGAREGQHPETGPGELLQGALSTLTNRPHPSLLPAFPKEKQRPRAGAASSLLAAPC